MDAVVTILSIMKEPRHTWPAWEAAGPAQSGLGPHPLAQHITEVS